MDRKMIDAYAAGLVDGEGCIIIEKRNGGRSFGPRVSIEMADKAVSVLEVFCHTYGGSITTKKEASSIHAKTLQWRVSGSGTESVLQSIAPYSILKKEQIRIAQVVLEIAQSQRRNRIKGQGPEYWTADARARCLTLYRRVQELNRRGPSLPPPAEGYFAQLVAGQWVTPQRDLLSDLGQAPFTGPWPRSGFMVGGVAYPLKQSEPCTSATVGSLSGSWPTPAASDWKGSTKTGQRRGQLTEATEPNSGGRLNPDWVELLMGFPPGWTDLSDGPDGPPDEE